MSKRIITFTITQSDLDKAITLQSQHPFDLQHKPQTVALARHRRKGGESYAMAGSDALIFSPSGLSTRYVVCGNAAQLSQLWLYDRHADILELLPLKVTLTPIESNEPPQPKQDKPPRQRKPTAKIDNERFVELWLATIEGGFSPSGGIAQVAHFMKMPEQSVVSHAAKLRKYGISLPHHRRR